MRAFLLTKHVYVATEIIKMLQSNNEIWAYDLRYNLIMQVAATQSYEVKAFELYNVIVSTVFG